MRAVTVTARKEAPNVLISQTTPATTSSVRLRMPISSAASRFAASVESRCTTAGIAVPVYDVRVPAFTKGGAALGVRAWSPPV